MKPLDSLVDVEVDDMAALFEREAVFTMDEMKVFKLK